MAVTLMLTVGEELEVVQAELYGDFGPCIIEAAQNGCAQQGSLGGHKVDVLHCSVSRT